MYQKTSNYLAHQIDEHQRKSKEDRKSKFDFERRRKLYLLLGGRSGRLTLHRDPATNQLIQVIDDESAPPALELSFEFLRDPQSSLPAYVWSWVLVAATLVRFIQLPLLTLDGPHFHENENSGVALYPMLPSMSGHASIFIASAVPLFFDSILRIVFSGVALFDRETELAKRVMADSSFIFLTFASICGTIPLIVSLFTTKDSVLFSDMTEMERIILRMLAMCIIVHVYRHVMHYTLIQIVSQSLQRTARHLVLPLLAFILFNMTFGVIFYFLEPCYNISDCHWHDLFEATVYSSNHDHSRVRQSISPTGDHSISGSVGDGIRQLVSVDASGAYG